MRASDEEQVKPMKAFRIAQHGLESLAITGGIAGILTFVAAARTEWGPPGTPEYVHYEHASRLIAIPWTCALIVLLGLLLLSAWRCETLKSPRIVALLAGMSGTLLILAGNLVEFWVFSSSSYGSFARGLGWLTFLLGHMVVLVATVTYFVAGSDEA